VQYACWVLSALHEYEDVASTSLPAPLHTLFAETAAKSSPWSVPGHVGELPLHLYMSLFLSHLSALHPL
jgi:hypothetical protein